MASRLLIYGANGHTGSLVARAAVAAHLEPVLAGRDGTAVAALARSLGVPHRVFALDDPAVAEAGVAGVDAVLNCAGPFACTAAPLSTACIAARKHYVDLSAEWRTLEELAALHDTAVRRRVMLLGGAGFDVVATDCLAAHLRRELPEASHLELAVSVPGEVSLGTASTIAENVRRGGVLRSVGRLKAVPVGSPQRDIDWGDGRRAHCVAVPNAAIASAHRSTGIPNVIVYAAVSPRLHLALRMGRHALWMLGPTATRAFVERSLREATADARQATSDAAGCRVWGEARDATRRVQATLRTGPAYAFTAQAAVAIAGRVLRGHAPHGHQTPASAYGPDFVLSLDKVARVDRLAVPS